MAIKKNVKKAIAKKAVAKKVPAKKVVKKAVVKKAPVKKVVAKKEAIVKVVKKAVPTPPARPVVITPKNGTTKQFTQGELFECILGSCGFTTKSEARKFYEGFAGLVQTSLKKGYKLVLPGLGKLQVKTSKSRIGRNPMTGAEIKIPARKKVRFTPLKALKDAVL
ncbi:MAG: HU family DNA-binding protein [Deltaproteobacteria bacterium]|nr:HU family DNA-binding protein [Deltaproteobacteria bacterium]